MQTSRRTWALVFAAIMVVGTLAIPGVPSMVEHEVLDAGNALIQILPGFTQTFQGAQVLGPLPPSTPLTVGVALNLPNEDAMDNYVSSLYSPGSPVYGEHLSASKFTSLFSPSAASYAAAAEYYSALGLTPLTTPDRLMLGLEGSAGTVGNAFHTSFDRYRLTDGSVVYGAADGVTVPAALQITSVTGMTNADGPVPLGVNLAQLEAAVTSVVHSPSNVATPGAWSCTGGTQGCNEPKFYNETGLFSEGYTGTGTNIGIVDAYDSAETQSDLVTAEKDFAKQAGITAPKENFWYPIPTTANLNSTTSSGWGGEEELDETVAFMDAPGATIDMTLASDSSFAVYEAVDFLVAHNLTNVISMSWGEQNQGTSYQPPENPCMPYYSCNASWDGSYFFLHPVFAEAVAEGITPFSAAGDCGAYDSTAILTTDYPSSDPFVVSVGGTQLNGSGWDTSSGAYTGETGWNGTGYECTANEGGGGGGYAPWAEPWWQTGPGQLTKGLRGVPDVSADSSDGTSQASPMWAGWVAVADQMHGGDLGLIGPELYSILRDSTAYAKDFHDIKIGNNYYSCGEGWSPVTGMGSPNAGNLLPALALYHADTRQLMHGSLNVTLAATSTSGSAPLSTHFTATASGGTAPYWYDFVPGLYLGQESNSPSLTYQYSTAGAYYASVVVWDSAGNSSVSNPILVNVGNSPLTAGLTASSTKVTEGQTVTYNGSASGGTSPYQFTYFFGDGTYAYNKSTTATHAFLSPGTYCAYAFVTDAAATADGGLAGPVCVNVTASSSSSGPSISSFTASPATIPLGGTTFLNVTATGGTGPGTYSYIYNSLPAGCTSTNVSSLACAPSATGTYSPTVTVTDAKSRSVTSNPATFSVASPGGPSISSFSASPTTIPLGGSTFLNVTATGGTGAGTYSYAYNGLPSGCASNNVSSLKCAPSASGTYSGITVTVTDAHKLSATSNPVNFTVSPSSTYTDPTISAFTVSPDLVPVNGTTYVNTTVKGGTGPGTYSYVYYGLPTGCVSQNVSSIACVPTSAGVSDDLYVKVTDAKHNSATSPTLSATVYTFPKVGTFTASPASISVGGTLYLNVTPTDGVAPYSWSFTSLPAGCTTSNTTTLACTPTAAGSYTVTATVTDHLDHSAQKTASFTVTAAVGAPTIQSFYASPNPVKVNATTTLEVMVTGGATPYSYAYSNLPRGCTSQNSASLSCTPTEAGNFSSVTVTVTDALGHAVTGSTWVDVSAGATPPSSGSTGPLGISDTTWIILLVVVAAIAAALVVVATRKPKSPPPPPAWQGYSDSAAAPWQQPPPEGPAPPWHE